jgi:hypothetical protein
MRWAMRVSQRALAAMMVVNVLAAIGVFMLWRFEYGLATTLLWSRYRDLEHRRVVVVDEEAMREHYLPEIAQGDPQSVVPDFFIGAYGGGSGAARVAVGLFVVNAIVLWVWLLRMPARPGDRCAQPWADEELVSSKKDPHPGPLP